MKWETLSSKTIKNELNFLKKLVIIQWKVWKKKDLLLFATKLTESVVIEHPKTLHKLYNIMLGSNRFYIGSINYIIYSDTKKVKIFLKEKNVK